MFNVLLDDALSRNNGHVITLIVKSSIKTNPVISSTCRTLNSWNYIKEYSFDAL